MFLLRFAFILNAFIFVCSCSNSQADASEKQVEHSSGSNEIILTTNNIYSWHSNYDIKDALINRIPVFLRISLMKFSVVCFFFVSMVI